MDDQRQEESAMTRYRVGVGEEFPMAERLKREFERGCRYGQARWREESGHWRGRFGGGGFVFGALAVLVALAAALSVAISYPLATLGVLAVLLLLSRGRRHGRHPGRRRYRPEYDA